MRLEKSLRKKRIFKKLFVFFSVFLTMSIMFSVTAFADPISPLEWVNDGEQPWGWPMDGIYESIRFMLFTLVKWMMSGSFGLMDDASAYATNELTQTPSNYGTSGAEIFNVVEAVSKNVILPIATIVFTYIVIYEFITMVMEKNNFHDFDTSIFFRWIVKTSIGIYFLTNTSTIINAFFDLGSKMASDLTNTVNAGLNTGGSFDSVVSVFENSVKTFGIGTFISMLLPCFLIFVVSLVIYVAIYVIVISRMIEIYLHISVAPIPMATITNREFGESGKNFLKIIFAFVLQAFFMLLCISIFKVLVYNVAANIGKGCAADNFVWDITKQLFETVAFGICLVLCMFKSNSLAKSILGAH